MKSRTFAVVVLAALALLAPTAAVPVAQAADITLTLAPGQEVTIPVRLWCLNYGLPFPTALGAPGPRAEDGVIAVLQAAMAQNTVVTDLYQTQLAIWRVPTGKFNDYGKLGTTLAEEIYNESTKITVAPIPAGVLTLDKAIADGKVTYQINNFGPVTATLAPVVASSWPFFGTADLVLKNVTQETVKFLFAEGTVFPPAAGQTAQSLLSHQDPVKQITQDPAKPSVLPVTGAVAGTAIPLLGAGAGLLLAGWALRSSRASQR